MTMMEVSRLIMGLRDKGWSEKEINDFIIWIGNGEPEYKPPEPEHKPHDFDYKEQYDQMQRAAKAFGKIVGIFNEEDI